MGHYDIKMGKEVARDFHSDIIIGHDIAMLYHDVTMYTDVSRILIYYVYYAQLWYCYFLSKILI